MSIEYWQSGSGMEKRDYPEKTLNLSQCHFVRHKSHACYSFRMIFRIWAIISLIICHLKSEGGDFLRGWGCSNWSLKCVIWRWTVCLPSYVFEFDVHVTVHRDKFLKIKLTSCTDFSNLFLEWNSTCFGQFLCPSSEFFHCTQSNGICHIGLLNACEQEHLLLLTSSQQTYMTYTIALCTVKKFWWWTEELSETCRVSFQK